MIFRNVIDIPRKEDSYFWYFYIKYFRGFDDENEINLDEAIDETVDIDKYISNFKYWYDNFILKENTDGEEILESSRAIKVTIGEKLDATVAFHLCETTFYLNDIYIGCLGGHFEAWFLTFEELLILGKRSDVFLLLLPMVFITEENRISTELLVRDHLNEIPIFSEVSDYIAKCIVNGLIVEGDFYCEKEVGLFNTINHSVRNVNKYPRYRENVIELNRYLEVILK